MPSIIYPSAWYTYGLYDPRTGIIFYIGKGSGKRAWQHARDVAAGRPAVNARKDAKIAEILKRGDEVEIQIFAEYDDENDALEHEFELVDSMPELTNIMPGGAGRTLKPEEIERRRSAREKRILDRRVVALVESAKRTHQRQKESMIATARGHKAEIELWSQANQPVEMRPVQFFARMHKGKPDVRFYPSSRPPKKRTLEARKAEEDAVRAEMEAAAKLEREKRLADRQAYLASLSPRQKQIFRL